jgi:hypothetical protein
MGMSKTATAFLAAGVAFAALVTVNAADAKNYRRDNWLWNFPEGRYCLSEPSALPVDCGYATFAQCNYSRNGTGGTCNPNPRFVEHESPRKRTKRVVR